MTSGVLECSVADIQAVPLEEAGDGYSIDVPSAARMLSHKTFVEFPVSEQAVKITNDIELCA